MPTIAVLAPIIFVAAAGEIPYGVAPAPWPESLGNHRVRIRVASKADCVFVAIPWRRRDPAPETKDVRVIDAATGAEVANRAVLEISRERGIIAFEPPTAPGEYFVHYLPYEASRQPHRYATHYAAPGATADSVWLSRIPRDRAAGPFAEVLEIQARTAFDRFDPMEVIATEEETRALIERHADRSVLLFPEDRRFPIRMTGDLPLRWIRHGPSDRFDGEAHPGEFYVFQIGVFAARAAVEDIAVAFEGLRGPDGARIPASAFRCFNFGGTDWLGRPFTEAVRASRGEVVALWIGIDVPDACPAGRYEGAFAIRARDIPAAEVRIALRVSGERIPDRGDRDLWRLARLRWLDSTIGIDDEVTAPYAPLAVDGASVDCLGRTVRFGAGALPASIRAGGREILAAPIAFIIETGEGRIAGSAEPRLARASKGTVEWEADSTAGAARIRTRAIMDYDGYVDATIEVAARDAVDVTDMRLEIPLRRDVATYMMGLGRKGGDRPKAWRWTWDIDRANHAVWIGDVEAGLHLKLKSPRINCLAAREGPFPPISASLGAPHRST
ncbi:MAG: hypothetical protein JXP34_20865, partial [Planctomycetes bacterium]|nr:hypothetical protein [Planctomycetota bacterium]